jgi:Protein of unknown function (DUF3892)
VTPSPPEARPQDFEIVAIHVEGPHEHITRFKVEGGDEHQADDAIQAIRSHERHYWARGELVQVVPCPDCAEPILWTGRPVDA